MRRWTSRRQRGGEEANYDRGSRRGEFSTRRKREQNSRWRLFPPPPLLLSQVWRDGGGWRKERSRGRGGGLCEDSASQTSSLRESSSSSSSSSGGLIDPSSKLGKRREWGEKGEDYPRIRVEKVEGSVRGDNELCSFDELCYFLASSLDLYSDGGEGGRGRRPSLWSKSGENCSTRNVDESVKMKLGFLFFFQDQIFLRRIGNKRSNSGRFF